MKRYILLSAMLTVGLTSCYTSTYSEGSGKSVEAAAQMTEKDFTLESFSSVKVSQGIEVTVQKSSDNKAKVSSNVMDYVVLEVHGDELYIKYKQNSRLKSANTKVVLYAKDVHGFQASSSGEITVNSDFGAGDMLVKVSSAGDIVFTNAQNSGKEVVLEASSSGTIKGDFTAAQTRIDASSAGKIDISKMSSDGIAISASSSASVKVVGNVNEATFDTSSAGKIDAKDLISNSIKAESSSGSRVFCSVKEMLNASASSGGSVHYQSIGKNLNVTKNQSSGGEVSEGF